MGACYRRGMTRAMTFLALMRGINVGGRRRLTSDALVAAFEAEGASHVRTFQQSGNVLFTAPARGAPALTRRVSERLGDEHGLASPIVLRSASELAAVAASHPLDADGRDPRLLHVAFLAGRPAPGAAARLDPLRSPPDELLVQGREVYLHCPNGMARTRLTNDYLDRTLGTVSTVRTWRTVRKLDTLARAGS